MTRSRAHGSRSAWLLLLPLAVSIAVAGCRDGTSSQLHGASLRVHVEGIPYDERTVAPGALLSLTARVLDQAGKEIPGQSIAWSSDAPTVARVDAVGNVEALAVGSARIIASSRALADTALVTVAAPVTGAPECAPGAGPSLQPGEVRTFSGHEAVLLCLPGGEAGAEYTLVTYNAGSTAASRLNARFDAVGALSAVGPPRPALEPLERHRDPGHAGFHVRMRDSSARALEPRLRAGVAPAALREIGQLAPNLALGSVHQFNVEASGVDPCNRSDMRAGRVEAVTERAVVVADVDNPSGGFSRDDYDGFGRFFDQYVWPLLTSTFGEPSDIDGNGKVIIFFTRAVNELSIAQGDNDSVIGGFFFNRDLFPTTGSGACAGSNAAEMFYMLVPDPHGEVRVTVGGQERQQAHSRAFVERITRAVVAHEFQHLINDSRRLHVNNSPVWEETWLNEGLSHIAEELTFYQQAQLSPRRNLGPDDFEENPLARDAFRSFQLSNYELWMSFLRAPHTSSFMGPDLLETRGAAWSFLRYAADRRGPGQEAALWRSLVRDSRSAGLANLAAALGSAPHPWLTDWAVAVYLDDTGLQAESRHRIPSWNFRDLVPRAAELFGIPPATRYPLNTIDLAAGSRHLDLQGGGVAYLRIAAAPGTSAAVRATVAGLPPPARLSVSVIRTR